MTPPVRTLYEVPQTNEPIVSSDFSAPNTFLKTDSPAVEETAIINEVQPDANDLDLGNLEVKSEPIPLSGGEFKPMNSSKTEETLKPFGPAEMADAPKLMEAPKALEIPKAVKAPKAIEVAKPIEIPKTVEIPKAIEVPKTVQVPTPTKIPTPAPSFPAPTKVPSSTFKPGEAFKPRRKVKPLDSTQLEQTSPSDQLLPKPNSDAKIVLRANPVDRNVIYYPPSKSTTRVIVPALQASFKNESPGNSLRGLAHTTQPAALKAAATIATNKVIETPAPAFTEIQPLPAVAQQQPKSIPVRLRAIPMNEKMIKGSQVKVRFKEQEPTLQVSNDWQPEERPTQQIPKPVPTPQPEALSQPTIEVADPLPPIMLHEHTARSDDAVETVTPPWRMK